MIISHSRHFTFVHIHKAGGSSVERALDPHLAWNDLVLGGSRFGERIQPPYSEKFGLNKHSSVADIEKICGSRYVNEYYLFALVRHPVARVCSIYNFVATMLNNWARRQNITLPEVAAHITPKAAKKTPSLNWTSSRVFLRSGSFSEFIRDESLAAAPGFRTQAGLLSPAADRGPQGEFFRLEEYPQWADALGKRIGVEFNLPHVNRSELRLVDPDGVPADDRALIESKFHVDYAAFGYDR
ncbi:MAG TPA: sulfotransferase family 2 domain-containing protein [Rhizomicrobium sp.]